MYRNASWLSIASLFQLHALFLSLDFVEAKDSKERPLISNKTDLVFTADTGDVFRREINDIYNLNLSDSFDLMRLTFTDLEYKSVNMKEYPTVTLKRYPRPSGAASCETYVYIEIAAFDRIPASKFGDLISVCLFAWVAVEG